MKGMKENHTTINKTNSIKKYNGLDKSEKILNQPMKDSNPISKLNVNGAKI
ncbi:uncharacterized protein DS421_12g375530 [Arachis hypogaea]|nr:uncharacterized protein DS421_12g375530 [Arachis hypogaea]